MPTPWSSAACIPAAVVGLSLLASPNLAEAVENPHPWASDAEQPEGPDAFAEAREEYHPYVHYPRVLKVDVSPEARARGGLIAEPVPQPDFHNLDAHKLSDEEIAAPPPTRRSASDTITNPMPDGWVQQGSVVLPADVADGFEDVSTGPIFAVEDIPGNQYPRKHTLFLNFSGGMLYNGSDNSAENRSTLALTGVYPPFGGGESIALAIIQASEADFAPFGIRIVYEQRPRNVVPYTMEMVGGDWSDTNIGDPAGGVAPGADCGALGQRHVVYTFSNGASVNIAAATIAQEAGHAYGLDHSFDCTSVMSYCGGGDKAFQPGCSDLCEGACQGAAGCRLTHEMFCGEGNDQQDDVAEMAWIFGGNEPDMEPPTVDILSPVDGDTLEAGSDIELRATVDDNYGGFGWKFIVTRNDEVIFDQPDYERDVDPETFQARLLLQGLDDGIWSFTVEAEDQYEHVTSQTVTVTVGSGEPSTTTDSGSDSDSDTNGDGSSGGSDSDSGFETEGASGTGDSGVDSDTDSSGGNQVDDGGGCSVSGQGSSGSLLLLALFGLVRRRRGSRA